MLIKTCNIANIMSKRVNYLKPGDVYLYESKGSAQEVDAHADSIVEFINDIFEAIYDNNNVKLKNMAQRWKDIKSHFDPDYEPPETDDMVAT